MSGDRHEDQYGNAQDATRSVFFAAQIEEAKPPAMSAPIDRFLATGDAAPKKKAKAPTTIRRVGLRCTNCGGSHSTRSCPYEKNTESDLSPYEKNTESNLSLQMYSPSN